MAASSYEQKNDDFGVFTEAGGQSQVWWILTAAGQFALQGGLLLISIWTTRHYSTDSSVITLIIVAVVAGFMQVNNAIAMKESGEKVGAVPDVIDEAKIKGSEKKPGVANKYQVAIVYNKVNVIGQMSRVTMELNGPTSRQVWLTNAHVYQQIKECWADGDEVGLANAEGYVRIERATLQPLLVSTASTHTRVLPDGKAVGVMSGYDVAMFADVPNVAATLKWGGVQTKKVGCVTAIKIVSVAEVNKQANALTERLAYQTTDGNIQFAPVASTHVYHSATTQPGDSGSLLLDYAGKRALGIHKGSALGERFEALNVAHLLKDIERMYRRLDEIVAPSGIADESPTDSDKTDGDYEFVEYEQEQDDRKGTKHSEFEEDDYSLEAKVEFKGRKFKYTISQALSEDPWANGLITGRWADEARRKKATAEAVADECKEGRDAAKKAEASAKVVVQAEQALQRHVHTTENVQAANAKAIAAAKEKLERLEATSTEAEVKAAEKKAAMMIAASEALAKELENRELLNKHDETCGYSHLGELLTMKQADAERVIREQQKLFWNNPTRVLAEATPEERKQLLDALTGVKDEGAGCVSDAFVEVYGILLAQLSMQRAMSDQAAVDAISEVLEEVENYIQEEMDSDEIRTLRKRVESKANDYIAKAQDEVEVRAASLSSARVPFLKELVDEKGKKAKAKSSRVNDERQNAIEARRLINDSIDWCEAHFGEMRWVEGQSVEYDGLSAVQFAYTVKFKALCSAIEECIRLDFAPDLIIRWAILAERINQDRAAWYADMEARGVLEVADEMNSDFPKPASSKSAPTPSASAVASGGSSESKAARKRQRARSMKKEPESSKVSSPGSQTGGAGQNAAATTSESAISTSSLSWEDSLKRMQKMQEDQSQKDATRTKLLRELEALFPNMPKGKDNPMSKLSLRHLEMELKAVKGALQNASATTSTSSQ
jgi:uncharacterized protein YeeX (DUF496 family)